MHKLIELPHTKRGCILKYCHGQPHYHLPLKPASEIELQRKQFPIIHQHLIATYHPRTPYSGGTAPTRQFREMEQRGIDPVLSDSDSSR